MGVRINGEEFAIVDSPRIRSLDADSFEVFGEETAEYRLRETDQTDPAGRYRWRLEDDEYLLQRSLLPLYAKPVDFIKAVSTDSDSAQGSHGIALVAWNEDGLEDMLKLFILEVETGGPIGLQFRELIGKTILTL